MTSPFDGVAGVVGAPIMAALNADMERAAVRMLEPRDGERLLVLGSGPGVGILALPDAVDPAKVVAVDPSRAMVRAARKRLARHPRASAVELHQTTAAELPPPHDFDGAVAVNSQQLWDPHDQTQISGSSVSMTLLSRQFAI